ncbi:MAG: response regulator [Rhodospirillaceae bacterium]
MTRELNPKGWVGNYGKSDYDIVDGDFADFVIANDKKAISAGRPTSNEEWVTFASDGHRALLETVKTPVFDIRGNIYGVLGIGHEITAIRAAEQAAQEASRFKSAFISNMSHEIRTPMNVIVGFANSLRRSAWSPADSDKLDKINCAADHLLGIISDILDLSKIEAGKLEIDSRPFSLHAMVSNVLDQVLPHADAKGLEVRVEVASDVPDWLLGDRQRLCQCLINYGGNAVKFTAAGVVTLRVRLDRRIGSGLLIRFETEDTGIGIAPDVLPRLFSSFVQADQSTTRRFGGTGLGLAFTRELANLMGGDVGVISTPDEGSCFWFTALLQQASGGEKADAPVPGGTAKTMVDFTALRLLVVEDVALNREVLQDMLDDAGIAADMAENGAVAVQRAGAFAYDLILMDMQMPVLDGLAATRAIRQLPGYAATPIIALTANAFKEDRERCLGAGMDDFLGKPLHAENLLAMVSRWLRDDSPCRPRQPSEGHPEAGQPVTDTGPGSREGTAASAVPPIVVKDLLENLDGNRTLARRLLEVFRDSFGKAGAEIAGLVDRERLELADNCAHALKGAAGQLAAYPLFKALGDLEIALQALPALVGEVTTALDATLAAADVLKGSATFPAEPPSHCGP